MKSTKPISLFIILLALTLRIIFLDLRPMHHDESVHAWITLHLSNYVYDPAYHGPFLYYATSLIFKIFGVSDFSARILPVIFGVLLITLVLLMPLEERVKIPVALYLTISPTFLYYSRFLRNDIIIAFWSLLIIFLAEKYLKTKRWFYVPLIFSVASLSLCTKENALILLFIFITFLLLRYPTRTFRWIKENLLLITFSLLPAILIYFLFFSSFLSHPERALTAIPDALSHWFEMHRIQRIGGPPYYYLPILLLYESPVLLFALAGCVYFYRKRDRRILFFIYWFLFSLLIYSYLGEKVPWLSVHILLPSIFIAFEFLSEISHKRHLLLLFLILSSYTTYSSVLVNYVHPANPKEPLVYVQTSVDVPEIVSEIKGHEIAIISEDYWPFPWYLRDENVSYWTKSPSHLRAEYLITKEEIEVEGYQKVRDFRLREWWIPQPELRYLPSYLLRRDGMGDPGALWLHLYVRLSPCDL